MSGDLREYFSKYPIKRVDKDGIILNQSEKAKNIYMVKLGYVKSYDITHGGLERIMSYASRGDVFPINYLFDDSTEVKYFYTASSNCELYVVPQKDFMSFLSSDNEACMQMCRNLAGSYNHVLERLNSIEQPKASEKILHTLKFLEKNYGRSGGDPTTHVEVPMKVQDLSSMVGLTRETVGAEIKKLKRAGVVTHRRWQFSINKHKLEELITRPLHIRHSLIKRKKD